MEYMVCGSRSQAMLIISFVEIQNPSYKGWLRLPIFVNRESFFVGVLSYLGSILKARDAQKLPSWYFGP